MSRASLSSGGSFDLDRKRASLTAFEDEMSQPDFWNRQERPAKSSKK